ncbi:MAG: hypothetical protein SGPRY_008593, partial [Prymnesium sp.]
MAAEDPTFELCSPLATAAALTYSAYTANTTANASRARGGKEDGPSRSHVCNWPDCGKGFSSRWSLERHARNHTSSAQGQEQQPDSFVERRLRERLRGVHQTLEKTREKLQSHMRQQQQAELDLKEARQHCEATQAILPLWCVQAEIEQTALHNKRISDLVCEARGLAPDSLVHGEGFGSSYISRPFSPANVHKTVAHPPSSEEGRVVGDASESNEKMPRNGQVERALSSCDSAWPEQAATDNAGCIGAPGTDQQGHAQQVGPLTGTGQVNAALLQGDTQPTSSWVTAKQMKQAKDDCLSSETFRRVMGSDRSPHDANKASADGKEGEKRWAAPVDQPAGWTAPVDQPAGFNGGQLTGVGSDLRTGLDLQLQLLREGSSDVRALPSTRGGSHHLSLARG